MAITNYDLT